VRLNSATIVHSSGSTANALSGEWIAFFLVPLGRPFAKTMMMTLRLRLKASVILLSRSERPELPATTQACIVSSGQGSATIAVSSWTNTSTADVIAGLKSVSGAEILVKVSSDCAINASFQDKVMIFANRRHINGSLQEIGVRR
jgi:hypothetical protein